MEENILNNIIRKKFSEIDFFDSLKRDYPGFDDWFGRKKDEPAFAQYENANLIGLSPLLELIPELNKTAGLHQMAYKLVCALLWVHGKIKQVRVK